MAIYEVKDNKTGRVYEIEGKRPPTPEEIKLLISKNTEQLSRQAATKSNLSEELPRMAGQIGGGIIGGVAGSAFGPAGTTLGAAGGAGIGAGLAEAIIQANKKFRGEQTPNVIGDVGKAVNTGVLGEVGFGTGLAAAKGAARLVGAGIKGVTLRLGSRLSKGAVEYGDKGGWKLIKSLKETPDEAALAASAAANKVDAAIPGIRKEASRVYGETLQAEGEKRIPSMTQPVKDLYRHLWNSRLVYRNSNGQYAISGIKGLNDELLPLMKRYMNLFKSNSRKLNINEARDVLRQVDAIAFNKELPGEIQTAAKVFRGSMRDQMRQTSPEMLEAISKYDATMETLGNANKLLIKEGEKRVVNPEKVSKFNRLHIEQRKALQDIDNLPGSNNFMPDVKKAAFLDETAPLTSPNRGLSMIGAGWGLVQLLKGNPGLAAAIGAGEALMSPRLAAYTLGLRQRGIEALSTGRLAKLAQKPVVQAVTDVTQRFGLANRLGGLTMSQGLRSMEDEQ